MSSLASLTSIARSALMAQQAAIDVVGHNVANATTPGYTRKAVVMSATAPMVTPDGNFGTGVAITDVRGTRDALLADESRGTGADAAGAATRRDLLSRIMSVLNEPSDTGLATAMDAFWGAWGDLSNTPTDAGARVAVQQQGAALARTFNAFDTRLTTVAAQTRSVATAAVARANDLAQRIAEINGRIVPAEASGAEAGDARDQRDLLLDELAHIVPITVIDRADGSNAVYAGSIPLVDGTAAKTLVYSDGPPATVRLAGSEATTAFRAGSLGAALDVLNGELADARASLDALASALVTDVNAVHAGGWSPAAGSAGNWDPLAGPTGSGVAFFDAAPANMTARGIRLSASVAADARYIAAGNAFGGTGNNTIALAVASLRDAAPTPSGGTFGGAYQAIVSTIAAAANDATTNDTVTAALAQQAKDRLTAVTGVSTDEELIRLMRHQQAYVAASRVIQSAQALADALLSLRP